MLFFCLPKCICSAQLFFTDYQTHYIWLVFFEETGTMIFLRQEFKIDFAAQTSISIDINLILSHRDSHWARNFTKSEVLKYIT